MRNCNRFDQTGFCVKQDPAQQTYDATLCQWSKCQSDWFSLPFMPHGMHHDASQCITWQSLKGILAQFSFHNHSCWDASLDNQTLWFLDPIKILDYHLKHTIAGCRTPGCCEGTRQTGWGSQWSRTPTKRGARCISLCRSDLDFMIKKVITSRSCFDQQKSTLNRHILPNIDASNPGHTAFQAGHIFSKVDPWQRDTVTSPLLVQILKLLLGMETWRIFKIKWSWLFERLQLKSIVFIWICQCHYRNSLNRQCIETRCTNFVVDQSMQFVIYCSPVDLICRTLWQDQICFFLHWNVVETLGGSGLGWEIFT